MRENLKNTGIVIVVSGPSGAGKSTVYNLARKDIDLYFSISCTTRQPRPGEKDGKDYYFISKDEFAKKVENDEFIEFAEVHGNSYGTLKSELLRHIENGRDVLLDIDVQGAMQIKERAAADKRLAGKVEFIFIAPPDMEELAKRLRGRNTESEKDLSIRLEMAKSELEHWRDYDYLLVNEDIESSVNELKKIIFSLHRKTKHIKGF